MMKIAAIRVAAAEDAASILAVYAPYVTDTAITFELEIPDREDFRARIQSISQAYPYLVYERDGKIGGYAYAHRHMERAGYQWNAELSVYVGQTLRGQGLGTSLYIALIELLRRQGVQNVYGCVTAPNPQSENLHRRLGFRLAGTQHATGYKLGKWHDVWWFEKRIGNPEIPPSPLLPFPQLDAASVAEVLKKADAFSFPDASWGV